MGNFMTESQWRYATASVCGTSHIETNTPCQDASECCVVSNQKGESVLIAIACDGAGSALRSEYGASMTCRLITKAVKDFVHKENSITGIKQENIEMWINNVCLTLDQQAIKENLSLRDFACTLIAAIISTKLAIFIQVGDGAIVIADSDTPDEFYWVFWPERGDYANTTSFITDTNFKAHLQFDYIEKQIKEVAILTDGLQHLALQYDSSSAYKPFFDGLFPPIRGINIEKMENMSNALANYLSSPKINQRTDDDKTLILATCR
jgi:hypothetical protein